MRFALAFAALCLSAAGADDRFLDWMNRIAQRQLDAREAAVARIHTPAEAQQRNREVRAKVLELIGGLPDYTGPLNARVTGKIERPGYVIEKVIFESLPRLYVTANLYRPAAAGKYPGILFPMGHWEEGKPAAQRMAANLALKGFVVLVYDPVGQGERQQAYDARLHGSLAGGATEQHFQNGAQAILAGENFARYRIWDAKRALDYLLSRPEVETSKVGCTGCSGGGTLTTYISALDERITVAAPACYINSWRLLFTGPTGDSEQSFPGFVAAGLDIPDYIELFAPKPWLISSTVNDFFPIEGARRAYHEAQEWYRIYGAQDKIRWAVGPGGHGTPLEIREAIYDWMIRWLKDGHGDPHEQQVEMAPSFELQVTPSGEVDGRELRDVIAEGLRAREKPEDRERMIAQLRDWSRTGVSGAPAVRTVSEQPGEDFRTTRLMIETEPGLEIEGVLYAPDAAGRKPGVVLVDMGPALAEKMARDGAVVLDLCPRGVPEPRQTRLSGNWLQNTRASVIGRNLPGLRAADIRHGVDVLAARGDVDAGRIRAAARGVSGIWLLMAAATDPRIGRIWVDRTPYSLRAAIDAPLTRNLYDAVMPGFVQHWDLDDMVSALGTRGLIWSDPADWMGAVAPHRPRALYRVFDEGDERFIKALLN